jgi:hypothetical protein
MMSLLRNNKFNYDENEPICYQCSRFAIASYTVIEKGPSKKMKQLLVALFNRTATREVPSVVVAERSLQQVCFHDVIVPHEVILP